MICCGYKELGDGFLATFDGPARAVRCAAAITGAIQPLGIAVRTGLHTGEIELAEAISVASPFIPPPASSRWLRLARRWCLTRCAISSPAPASASRTAAGMRFAVCPLLCISIRYWLRTEIQTLTSAEDRFSTGAAGFVSVSKVGLGA